MHDKILYSALEISELVRDGDTVLIDIRDESRYLDGHLPGAINEPEMFYYLSENYEEGFNELRRVFTEIFSRAGLSADKTAIIYEDDLDSRFGSSFRGYEILHYMGHEKAGVLDGGYSAWVKASLPVETLESKGTRVEFQASPQDDVFVTKEDVLAAINDPSIVILDNRDSVEWRGESSSPYGVDYAPRKGRIPGAIWIEWYEFLDRSLDIPAFKSAKDITAICAQNNISPDSDIIIYCFKGSRAANTYIALKKSGFKKLRIYFGSWNEWSREFSLPIDDEIIDNTP